MRTSFHHQPEAQHPNFPLSTSCRPITPSLAPLLGMSGSNTASQLEIRFCRQRGDLLRSTECQRTLIHYLAAGPPVLLAGQ
jgi:hypothetical protein